MTANTLAALLLARAEDDRPGVMFEDTAWSWRAYVAACRAAGAWLSARGTRLHVGVLSENVPGLLFLLGGAALRGHVVVALNPTRPADELARDARATDVGLLLWDGPYEGVARSLGIEALPLSGVAAGEDGENPQAAPDPGDLVMLIFTSGTSGRPRAVRVTQRKIASPRDSPRWPSSSRRA
jgi:fatty-acyl-CoA synthase